MGTYAAQMLIGNAHPYHGGIHPSHVLFYSVNSRPAWVLQSFQGESSIVWIPCPDTLLKDAMVMVALHVFKSEPLRKLAPELIPGLLEVERFEWCEDATPEQKRRLYEESEKVWQDIGCKVIVVAFDEGRELEGEAKIFAEYPGVELEVCTPKLVKLYNAFSGDFRVKGTLEKA